MLRQSDPEFADALFEKFSRRLCSLVSQRIGPKLRAKFDADDIMQSAFWSFLRVSRDRADSIDHGSELWSLLASIAIKKFLRKAERFKQQKRSIHAEVSAWSAPDLREMVTREPTAEQALSVIETLEWLEQKLEPFELHVFNLRLHEDMGTVAIAEQVGVSRATVRRCLIDIGRLMEDRLRDARDEAEAKT